MGEGGRRRKCVWVCEREIGRDKEREGGKEKYLANVIFVSREGHKNGMKM